MIPSRALIVFLGCVVGATPGAVADFTSASLRAAGFEAADGGNAGQDLSGAQSAQVTAAIDLLAATAGSTTAECVTCLRALHAAKRICVEGGTSTAGATTLPDKKAGCDGTAEGIHVNPAHFSPPWLLACTLAHEWFHVNQTAADYAGNFERPAYQHEVDCLDALGQGASGRRMQMADCVAALARAPETPPFDSGRVSDGGKVATYPDGFSYSVVSNFNGFYTYHAGTGVLNGRLINVPRPFDFHVYDANGAKAVVICGTDATGNNGLIENYLIINDGATLFPSGSISLPGGQPFALCPTRDGSSLLVLDTASDSLMRIERDGKGLYNTQAGTYADAATFPALNGALLAVPNFYADLRGAGDSVVVGYRDSRAGGVILMEDRRAVLFDDDGDGAADRSLRLDPEGGAMSQRDFIAIVPGFTDDPGAGDMSVEVFAGAGVNVEIESVDMDGVFIGLLGSGAVSPSLNEATVALSRALVAGEYIQAVDTDNVLSVPAHVYQVPAGACPADLVPPVGVLDIFDIIEYLGLFDAEDSRADLVAPFGSWDIFDIIEYLGLFDAGCP